MERMIVFDHISLHDEWQFEKLQELGVSVPVRPIFICMCVCKIYKKPACTLAVATMTQKGPRPSEKRRIKKKFRLFFSSTSKHDRYFQIDGDVYKDVMEMQ
jgi:hypothetical protein